MSNDVETVVVQREKSEGNPTGLVVINKADLAEGEVAVDPDAPAAAPEAPAAEAAAADATPPAPTEGDATADAPKPWAK